MKKMIVTAAVIASFVVSVPLTVCASIDVNVQIDGYLPAPPGVHILLDAGRPYYLEDSRRVYVEKKHKKNKGKQLGEYKEHEDQGAKNGHGKKGKHDD
jgi:hypothetical protein